MRLGPYVPTNNICTTSVYSCAPRGHVVHTAQRSAPYCATVTKTLQKRCYACKSLRRRNIRSTVRSTAFIKSTILCSDIDLKLVTEASDMTLIVFSSSLLYPCRAALRSFLTTSIFCAHTYNPTLELLLHIEAIRALANRQSISDGVLSNGRQSILKPGGCRPAESISIRTLFATENFSNVPTTSMEHQDCSGHLFFFCCWPELLVVAGTTRGQVVNTCYTKTYARVRGK